MYSTWIIFMDPLHLATSHPQGSQWAPSRKTFPAMNLHVLIGRMRHGRHENIFLSPFSNNYKNCWEPGSIADQSCHVLQDIVGISWREWQSLRSSIALWRQGVGWWRLVLSLGSGLTNLKLLANIAVPAPHITNSQKTHHHSSIICARFSAASWGGGGYVGQRV